MNKKQSQLFNTFYRVKGLFNSNPFFCTLDRYLVAYELVKLSTLFCKAKPIDLLILPKDFIINSTVRDKLKTIHSYDVNANDLFYFHKFFNTCL